MDFPGTLISALDYGVPREINLNTSHVVGGSFAVLKECTRKLKHTSPAGKDATSRTPHACLKAPPSPTNQASQLNWHPRDRSSALQVSRSVARNSPSPPCKLRVMPHHFLAPAGRRTLPHADNGAVEKREQKERNCIPRAQGHDEMIPQR